MNQQTYTPSFLTDILDEWNYNQTEAICPMSMRQFCKDWNVPRSTFQGWINKQAVATLPSDRFYSKPTETDTKKPPIDTPTVEVLRLLANELSAISSDLNEILDRL